MMTDVVVGIDEVNFSPSLAGDCVVCAIYLPRSSIRKVKDSKDTTPKQRRILFEKLQKVGVYAIQTASIADIRDFGIVRSRNIAAISALDSLKVRLRESGREITRIQCDTSIGFGLKDSSWAWALDPITNAGRKRILVAAASIVAKIYFDAMMDGFGNFWPGYGMEHDHGSPSASHLKKLRSNGPSPIHRTMNYAPGWWEKILHG